MKTGRHSTKERLLAIIMSLMMVFQMMPFSALADEVASDVKQGTEYWTVTFKANGGTVETLTVEDGSTVANLPTDPTGDAPFIGWYVDDTEFTTSTVVNSDLTVTAKFGWTLTFYNRDAEVIKTVKVENGTAIGSAMPATIAREDYIAYWAIGNIDDHGTTTIEQRIDSTYVPTADKSVVPDYDKVTYTVTFYTAENKTEVVATKTVNADTSYCLNDIPSVPTKTGSTGKWVYSNGDFGNTVKITEDTAVWAEYDQNVFTVTFKLNADDENAYQTDTYYKNDQLTLPADPVVEGKDFTGWYVGETQYEGGEAVTSDLTLIAAFTDQYYVDFVILNDDGTVSERLSQYFRSAGESIGTMPQDPFVAGKVFEKWVIEGTETEVTASTVVNESFNAVAVFRTVTVYKITAEYYYIGSSGEVVFNKDLIEVEEHEIPYTITAPSSTKTDPNEVSGAPIYYPETPTVTIKKSVFNDDNEASIRFKYVPYTAEYDFVYKLKDLTGDGYTEIADSREHVYGVLNSYVTPTVKTFDYAELEMAQGADITQATGQELYVYYTRKSYQLTYETNGGSYVGGVTVPYGKEESVTSTVPTRTGYTFAGWYLDEELTQAAGNTVTVNGDTTLYAKWNGATVNYTIVYMFEKYNDTGTESSYVYDNSKDATGTVGSTVQASSAPTITRTGWEKDTERNNNSSVEIQPDGSSVLFVYYKLTEYTFNFRPGTYGSGWNSYNVTASLNGESKTGNNNYSYSFKAKLGQDISSLWLSASNGTYRYGNVNFSGWIKTTGGSVYVTKRLILTDDMLPSSGTTVTYEGYWLTSTITYTVNYWLQNANDDGYSKSETYSQTYEYSTGSSISPKDISGFTYDHREDSDPHSQGGGPGATTYYTTTDFYYNRDTYQIDYYYGSALLENIDNVKFDADINKSPYVWTPTAAQCGVDSDYTFAGWYSDSGLTTEYTFKTMPASNLVVYAKWIAPSYTVTFVDGENTTTVYDTETVEKYKKVSAPETSPTKDGYIFDGWYTTADGTDLYDWNNQITANTTIYAHWTKATLSYTVHYVDDSEEHNSVAEDKVVTNPNFTVGQEITESAIAIAGYRPQTNSETLTLAGSGNEITFVYVAKGDFTSYTVKYILDPEEYEGNIPVADAITVENVPGDTASVIELAAAVDYTTLYADHSELSGVEFYPDAVEKTLILAADEEQNVLVFYYSSYKHATVTVNFVDMNGEPIADQDVQILKVGKTFTLSRTPIAGWELNKAVVGANYSGDEAGSSYKITEEITANGLTFTLFYQKKLTITVASASKLYDGKALTLPTALADQVIVEGLLDDDELASVAYTYTNPDPEGSNGRVNAGVTTVKASNASISGTHESNPDYYTIRYISGTLEVTKINVTIRVEPDRWTGNVYDGTVKKTGFTNPGKGIADYVLISHEGYAEEYLDDIWAAVASNATYDSSAVGLGYVGIAESDVGDYTYFENAVQLADLPVDPNYSVSLYVRPGRLQILPKAVTITTGSAEKQYDGTALTKDEATIDGIVDGETYKLEATGTQTEVGSSENTYSITWAAEGNDYTAKEKNYTITETLGTLTVTNATLTIVVKGKTITYNGQAQDGYVITGTITGTGTVIDTDDYTVTGLANGDVLTVSGYTPSNGTDAGTYTNGTFDNATVSIVNAAGTDVTDYYTITTEAGKLTINPAPVTITTGSDSKEYDGTPLTKDEASITGLVNNETATVTATGSQTEVGSSDNTYSIDWGTTNKDNYTVTEQLGTLEVTTTDDEVTLTAPSDSKTYDGTALTCDGTGEKKVTASGLPEGFTVEATASGSQTNAGSSANVVDDGYVIKDAAGNDKTSNFTKVTKVDGTLTVDPAPVTITTGSDSKEYDGTPLTKDEASITGLVNNETATVTATGSQTEVGSSEEA